jgi:hypothetical protein
VFDQFERGLSVNLLKYSNKYAVVSIDLRDFDKFKEKLFKATYLDKITQISPYKDRIDKYLEESISAKGEDKEFDVEVDFFPKLKKERYKHATDAIKDFLLKYGEKFDENSVTNIGSDNIFLKMTGHDIKKIGAGVATVSKIFAKPEVLIDSPSPSLKWGSNESISQVTNASSVNVIDTGVDRQNPLANGLVTDATHDYSNVTSDSRDNDGHGTFVSGLVCYGCDNLEKGIYQPEFKVNMAKIMDSRQIKLEDLTRLLPRAINDFKQYSRVFNISINVIPKSLSELSSEVLLLCESLDELARSQDLIVCVSAGNIKPEQITSFYQTGNPYPSYFKSREDDVRVLPPANCCNIISVGSFVAEGKGAEPARNLDPSPFTRRGNTLNDIQKPDVVESGGNIVIDDDGTPEQTQLSSVTSLSRDGNGAWTCTGVGTSFASPLVARLAAKILDKYGNVSANLVRGLIVNSCEELGGRQVAEKFGIKKQTLYGFGHPLENYALNSLPYRVTLYCEGKIGMNECHFIDFYVPEELKKPRATSRLIITLVYDPPVDRTFLPDKSFGGYTRLVLRPYLRKKIGDRRYSKVSATQMVEGVSNWTSEWSNSPIKNAVFEWDRYGFGEMWQVKIKPERHGIDDDFEQNYAVVITLETDHQGVQIYDRIASEMNVPVEEIIRERVTASLALP